MTSTMFYSLMFCLTYTPTLQFYLGHSLQNNSHRPLIKGRIVFLENKHLNGWKV